MEQYRCSTGVHVFNGVYVFYITSLFSIFVSFWCAVFFSSFVFLNVNFAD